MKTLTTISGLLLLAVFSATIALADPNGLDGAWSGSSESIYPTGDRVTGVLFDGIIYQESGSGLFYGEFTYTLAGVGSFAGFVTGYMDRGGTLTGLLSLDLGNDEIKAVATVEGQLTGNKIFAVTRDFSDGTTSILTAYRVR